MEQSCSPRGAQEAENLRWQLLPLLPLELLQGPSLWGGATHMQDTTFPGHTLPEVDSPEMRFANFLALSVPSG